MNTPEKPILPIQHPNTEMWGMIANTIYRKTTFEARQKFLETQRKKIRRSIELWKGNPESLPATS